MSPFFDSPPPLFALCFSATIRAAEIFNICSLFWISCVYGVYADIAAIIILVGDIFCYHKLNKQRVFASDLLDYKTNCGR